ncbi:NPS5 [Fusarium coicis]|nr:NPS5 [Fusarium coicis]
MHFVNGPYQDPDASYLHESEIDNIIRALAVEVLNLPPEQVPLRCSFFAFGSNSISTMAVVSRSPGWAIECAIQDIFKYKTITTLAQFISQANKPITKGDAAGTSAGLVDHIRLQITVDGAGNMH